MLFFWHLLIEAGIYSNPTRAFAVVLSREQPMVTLTAIVLYGYCTRWFPPSPPSQCPTSEPTRTETSSELTFEKSRTRDVFERVDCKDAATPAPLPTPAHTRCIATDPSNPSPAAPPDPAPGHTLCIATAADAANPAPHGPHAHAPHRH